MSGLIFDELTAQSTTAKYALGTSLNVGGKSYLYVQIDASSAACANGTVLGGTLADMNVVTTVTSAKGPNQARGVGIGVIAISSFGWIQTWGAHSAVKTDGGDDITTNDTLILDSATAGVCDSVAAGTASTYKPIGYATAVDVDADNTVAAFLTLEKGQ